MIESSLLLFVDITELDVGESHFSYHRSIIGCYG